MSGWPIHNQSSDTKNGDASWAKLPATGAIEASPPTPRKAASPRLRLETVRDCRRELKKLFIAARNGEITTQTATRLAYLLDLTSRMIERSELEKRIEALEAQDAAQ